MKDRNVKFVHLYVKDKKGKVFAASMMCRRSSDVRDLYNALRIASVCQGQEGQGFCGVDDVPSFV
nr:MAG TPA: hypothetical protein [Caudoviricetes sp.]